jgi:hypothetical protein
MERFEEKMRPGNDVGALEVLYLGWGDEVRGQGKKSSGRWWVFNTGHFEARKERDGRRLGTA